MEHARAGRLSDCRRLVHLTGPRKPALSNRLADVLFVLSGPGMPTSPATGAGPAPPTKPG